ncbi:Cellulose biosynthesis protein BcsQ [Haloechinothrix alba]|uniref:Cellulose biosynthesis protein BcsQ n=1 Tax=Haloechinothrix alba TaxID=664784 RepID=A0A238WFN0_9PSEU|nr:ParA family protein [Haloechinothrix alba]SNR45237.1 Cellulose biosynthesis protein BcsQ [Haloechinothrix alba]
MQTVAVLSLKGGVGKTTVALGLASAALRRGSRALVVDLDPQCNATATLDPRDVSYTLADVLATPRPPVLQQAIATSSWSEDLDVLAGSEDVEALNEPSPNARTLGSLARALAVLENTPLERQYDLIILDCPPSLGRLTRSALTASHGALLVTEPTMYAVSGARRAFEAIENTRTEHNPELRALGVLVNKFRNRSQEHHYRIQELREGFGPLVMPVALPDRLAVQQASGACTAIHEWQTPGGREIALAFNLVLARILRSSRRGRHHLQPPSGEGDPAEFDGVEGDLAGTDGDVPGSAGADGAVADQEGADRTGTGSASA